MKKYDGIIFDVDGTIWDTTKVVADAWNQALISVDLPHLSVTADMLKGLFGLPMDVIIANIMPEEPVKKQQEFLPICSEFEFNYLNKQGGIIYEGLDETLKILSENYLLFIVSNCQSGYVELVFEKTGFGKYFKDHLCPGDSGLLKADNIKLISKNNDIKHPIYVGDTQMDADACKNANVPIIHASYGFGKVKNPDYTINTPKELLSILL